MELDEPLRDPRTVVAQLRDRVAEVIRSEKLRPGDRLPTEAQLTQRFKVSRPALREALKLLEQDGLISVTHGRGRFVTASSAVKVDRPITVFESVTDMSRHYGYEPTIKVLSVAEQAADPETRSELQLGEDEAVIRLERLRLQGDEPLMYSVDYIPRNIVPTSLEEIDWSGSLLTLLESYQCRPRMSAASVSSVMLPDDIAKRYGLKDFGPVLLIAETCFDTAGTPVVRAAVYHRGSRFSFSLARR